MKEEKGRGGEGGREGAATTSTPSWSEFNTSLRRGGTKRGKWGGKEKRKKGKEAGCENRFRLFVCEHLVNPVLLYRRRERKGEGKGGKKRCLIVQRRIAREHNTNWKKRRERKGKERGKKKKKMEFVPRRLILPPRH